MRRGDAALPFALLTRTRQGLGQAPFGPLPVAVQQGLAPLDFPELVPGPFVEFPQGLEIPSSHREVEPAAGQLVARCRLGFRQFVERGQDVVAARGIDDDLRHGVQEIHLLQDRVEAVEDVAAERIEQPHWVLVLGGA